MNRLIIALVLFATVSRALPTNDVNRMATESYVLSAIASSASAVSVSSVNGMSNDVIITASSLGVDTGKVVTAFNYGPHVGLYLGVGWQPAWTNIVGLPSTFTPSAHSHDQSAITNAPWTVASVVSNIVAYAVGVHDALTSAHSTLFGATVKTNDLTYTSTVSKAASALQSFTEQDTTALGSLGIHATNTTLHVTANERSSWLTLPGVSNVVNYIVGIHDSLTNAHAALFSAKADKSTTITFNDATGDLSTNLHFMVAGGSVPEGIVTNFQESVTFSNFTITGVIHLPYGIDLSAEPEAGSNTVFFTQPGDTRKMRLVFPPAPQ